MTIPKKKIYKGSSAGSSPKKGLANQRLTYVLAWLSVAFCWCFGLPSLLLGGLALWRMKGRKPKGLSQKLGQFAAVTGMVTGFCFTLYYVASLVAGAYIHFN